MICVLHEMTNTVITMNSELSGGVVISSATDVSASIFRGAFVDDQRALSPQRMDAKVLPWFQFHIILQINHFFQNVTCVLYTL